MQSYHTLHTLFELGIEAGFQFTFLFKELCFVSLGALTVWEIVW